jgi:hypothetical protein
MDFLKAGRINAQMTAQTVLKVDQTAAQIIVKL